MSSLPILVVMLLSPLSAPPSGQPSFEAYFSPDGGCTDAIVREIDRAKDSVRIQAYGFTSKPISQAVMRAIKRRVKVTAVLDQSNRSDRYSAATFLKNQGAEVRIDDRHPIAHNKVMIIDDAVLITGSFNFTAAAERNAENVLIIKRHSELVRKYLNNWREHYDHSVPYEGPRPSGAGERVAHPPSGAQPPAEDDPTVYVTRSGKRYHAADCSYLRPPSIPMRLSEAGQRYSPCGRCHPPVPKGG